MRQESKNSGAGGHLEKVLEGIVRDVKAASPEPGPIVIGELVLREILRANLGVSPVGPGIVEKQLLRASSSLLQAVRDDDLTMAELYESYGYIRGVRDVASAAGFLVAQSIQKDLDEASHIVNSREADKC